MNIMALVSMTDSQIHDMIQRIAISGGRGEKEQALASMAATEEGRRIINWCYNPFITFGITWRKEPTWTAGGDGDDPSQMPIVHNLLSRLASRDLTGNDAKTAVQSAFDSLNPAAGRILWLCLNKDLKAGVAEASIKSIDPSLIPIFSVMRAHTFEERHVAKFPVAGEPKLDGNRVSFITRDGSGGFFTRTGKVIASMDSMVPPVITMLKGWIDQAVSLQADDPLNEWISSLQCVNGVPSVMLDGEMMSDKGFDSVNGALNAKDDRTDGLSFNIFDALSWQEFDAMGEVKVSYIERRRRVNSIVVYASGIGMSQIVRQTPIEILNSHDEIQEAYQRWRNAGQEGLMVKDLQGFYQKKKSRSWLKLKNEDTEDLPVIGAYQGREDGKYANTIGGLIVDRNGVAVRVSGISDEAREEMWTLWGETCNSVGVSADCGYEGLTFKLGDKPGPLLGRLIEVEFHEATKDGSLRHPRFVRFRDDKTGEVDKS
ncbi:hypothetical protein HGG70_07010 [Rhodobacteraceae bacterium R_SAG4]|nr:hypothetical protein [Rhodobacteraceae bacterium R_SAG4]